MEKILIILIVMESLHTLQKIFYAIGALLSLYSIYRHYKYKSLETWVEVPATIEKIKEVSTFVFQHSLSSISLDLYYPVVDYSYSYKGVKYESRVVSLDISNIWIPMRSNEVTRRYDHRFWYTWKKGLKINAYFNPTKPKKSVLIKKMSKTYQETNKSLFVAGILIISCGYYAIPYLGLI